MKRSDSISIDHHAISKDAPTYFIADIAANHDGDLSRAVDLIYKAADAGADAAKFQHFQAETIVSDYGFKNLGGQLSHQSTWTKSVFEVYKDASVSLEWTDKLKKACSEAGISFFSTPYSLEVIEELNPYVPAYKIGSGDITWIEMIEKVASMQKPYMLATGASSIEDVIRAVDAGNRINNQLILMQCNTNYTASIENFKYVNLNVLKLYQRTFPDLILGLSDHTMGHATVLGAVALGARVIEKHFTDSNLRDGPDHKFSMDPRAWAEMVDRTRELEFALGGELKVVEENEKETVIVQRRSSRFRFDLKKGHQISKGDIIFLRPCPSDGIGPYELEKYIGLSLSCDVFAGDHLKVSDLKNSD